MVINPKIKILERGKLSRINEINPWKMKTRAKFICRKAFFTFLLPLFVEFSPRGPEHQ